MSEQQYLSLAEAGELVGKSRSTMWRAMKSGKLSVEKDENDHWIVSVSELLRVYPKMNMPQQFKVQHADIHSTTKEGGEQASATDVLQAKFDMLQEEKARLLAELDTLRDDVRDERRENREEREKLLGLVENAQKQLTHERDRFDEEIKRTKAKLRSFAQEHKVQRNANSNKVLQDKPVSSSKTAGTIWGYLFGRQ